LLNAFVTLDTARLELAEQLGLELELTELAVYTF
jgi:hypothetical protein